MSKATVMRVSLSMPFDVVKGLDRFADAAGISRSACASALLKEAMPALLLAAQSLEEMNRLTNEQQKLLQHELAILEQRAVQANQENTSNSEAILSLIHTAKFKNL